MEPDRLYSPAMQATSPGHSAPVSRPVAGIQLEPLAGIKAWTSCVPSPEHIRTSESFTDTKRTEFWALPPICQTSNVPCRMSNEVVKRPNYPLTQLGQLVIGSNDNYIRHSTLDI